VRAVIVGGGPAGWVAAGAAQAAGWDVALIDPQPDRVWHPTYCAWVDAVPEAFREAFGVVWPDVELVLSEADRRVIERPYGWFDNRALRAACQATASSCHVLPTSVVALQREGERMRIRTEDGDAWADAVLDCTGIGRFVHGRSGPRAAQTALGRFGRPGPGGGVSRPVFMDFRPAGPEAAFPSFGYVLPFATDRVLVEETVLAGRPVVDPEGLRRGLAERAESFGIRIAPTDEEEKVFIGMGGTYPQARQEVAGFGAAAHMAHPATGYLVAHVLRRRAALEAGFRAAAGGTTPEDRVEAIHRALFPGGLRRTRYLHNLGLEVLLRLDRAGLQRFFRAFFAAPESDWRSYMMADAGPGRVASAMWSTFLGLPGSDRWRVMARVGGAAWGRGPDAQVSNKF
jgi:lycopene beta-cyclase